LALLNVKSHIRSPAESTTALTKAPHEYILLLGSNMGESARMLEKARSAVKEHIGEVTASSAMFSSEAWGFESPDMFVNQALRLSSILSPMEVLNAIHSIESSLGRMRLPASGYISRTIDIDILHWEGGSFVHEQLTIPHPRIAGRRFALVPMCQIAKTMIHPATGQSYEEMLNNCTDNGEVLQLLTVE
jgi:2-amino-4-hydroxy-6-hydroxymethyldihydropteridine diphosphokinase